MGTITRKKIAPSDTRRLTEILADFNGVLDYHPQSIKLIRAIAKLAAFIAATAENTEERLQV